MPGREIGRFQPQGVVLVLGDVFFVGRRFVGGLRGPFGDVEIDPQPVDNQLVDGLLIHDQSQNCRTLARLFALGAVWSCCSQN
ncbi:hypothetical protein D9M69_662810 [compost metagenome]